MLIAAAARGVVRHPQYSVFNGGGAAVTSRLVATDEHSKGKRERVESGG